MVTGGIVCNHFCFTGNKGDFINMKKKQKTILIVIIVIIAAIICVLLFLRMRNGSGKTGGDAAYVESVAEISGAQNAGVQNRYSGVVESQETWDINLSSEQTVKEVFVEEGSEVHEGDPLFEYDTSDLTLQVAQAKLELEEIQNEVTGYNSQIKALNAEKKTVDKNEQFSYTVQIQSLENQIKQAEYNQQSKELEIEKLQATLSDSTVLSKIDGVVKSVNTENTMDDMGNAQPFMSILTTGDYRVKGVVNETNVWMLEEGMPVILRSRVDNDSVWYGTIQSIDTENQEKNTNDMYMSDSDSGMNSTKYPFYVSLSSIDGLMLGQHVYIELDEGQETELEGIWLYSSYIVMDGETDPFIWADNGRGKLEKRIVELGEYNEDLDMYQIVSGLTEEDLIAWAQPGLAEGMNTTTDMDESILMKDTLEDEDMMDMEGIEGSADMEYVDDEEFAEEMEGTDTAEDMEAGQ